VAMVGIPSDCAVYHGGTLRGTVSSVPFGKDAVIKSAPPQKTYVCVIVARPEGEQYAEESSHRDPGATYYPLVDPYSM